MNRIFISVVLGAILIYLLWVSPLTAQGKTHSILHGRKGAYNIDVSVWNKAIEVNPKDAIAWFNRGNANYDEKNYDQAISDYTKALEIKPEWASAYYNRAKAYASKGQYDQVINDYTKVLEIDPGDDWAYNNRGVAYYHKGHYDKAISDYNKALDIFPDYVPYYNKAVACDDAGQIKEAIESYRNFIRLAPVKYFASAIEYANQRIMSLERVVASQPSIKKEPKRGLSGEFESKIQELPSEEESIGTIKKDETKCLVSVLASGDEE